MQRSWFKATLMRNYPISMFRNSEGNFGIRNRKRTQFFCTSLWVVTSSNTQL